MLCSCDHNPGVPTKQVILNLILSIQGCEVDKPQPQLCYCVWSDYAVDRQYLPPISIEEHNSSGHLLHCEYTTSLMQSMPYFSNMTIILLLLQFQIARIFLSIGYDICFVVALVKTIRVAYIFFKLTPTKKVSIVMIVL
jgi:multidrug transporter EmrE-like cation transporter